MACYFQFFFELQKIIAYCCYIFISQYFLGYQFVLNVIFIVINAS